MVDVLLDLTLLGAVDWSRNPCRHCLRPKAEHTGPFLACPDRVGPQPGEQMWLDDVVSAAGATGTEG